MGSQYQKVIGKYPKRNSNGTIWRVLKPGGIAILTVPWFNPLRRLKAWAGCFNGSDVRGMEFYQYAYRASEMKEKLAAAGFEVVDNMSSRNIKMGLEDELPFLECVYKRGVPGRILKRIIRRGTLAYRLSGHTRIYVCRKP